MDNQKIFEMLADAESVLFYAKISTPGNERILTAWETVRNALEEFAAATGCHN